MSCPIFLPRVVTGQCWSVEKQTKRRQRVLVRERIWSLNCWKSCKCDDTNDKSVFWWLRCEDKRLGGFCWWSAEEEAKENSLSDVEELLNANWIHSFTFQFGPVQKYKIHLQKYKIHWEIEKKKQRKILSMTWKNYSMPTGLGLTLLHFNLGHIGLGS